VSWPFVLLIAVLALVALSGHAARLRRAGVVVRAHAAAWRQHGHRPGPSRGQVTSAALMVAGMAWMLGGGALVGTWCLGLVLIAESAGLVWFGLFRDDGVLPRMLPRPGGPRSHEEILEMARHAP